jgi:hypothetical protein
VIRVTFRSTFSEATFSVTRRRGAEGSQEPAEAPLCLVRRLSAADARLVVPTDQAFLTLAGSEAGTKPSECGELRAAAALPVASRPAVHGRANLGAMPRN